MTASAFDVYLRSLGSVSPQPVAAEPEALDLCARATAAIQSQRPLNRASLAGVVADDPAIIPVLAAVAGLSQERFKTWLTSEFDTAGWMKLGKARARDLVDALDDKLGLIALLEAQAERTWTWADVLARVMSSRQQAGASVQQGRDLEDAVEAEVSALGVPFQTRTRFTGRGGQTAPADFVIPDGEDALIAVAVKGFDSTGSKLTDATREIEQMVEVAASRQYIFAVVDGLGWMRRQGDLRRIHSLWEQQLIDGLYTRRQLDQFGDALDRAAKRVGLGGTERAGPPGP